MMRTDGIDETVRDLGQAPGRTVKKIKPVMKKAGVQMKRNWTKSFRSSPSFRVVGKSVTFDVHDSTAFGTRNIQVEVGPDASRDSAAALAGIATFGGSRGGGGSVPEPDQLLKDEADTAEKFIADIIGEALQ